MSSVAATNNAAILEKYKAMVGTNRDHALSRWMLAVHGPPGHGKSWFAASASKDWPAQLNPKAPTRLTDMIWLTADSGATAGLAESGIEVDEVNVRDLIAMHNGNMPQSMSAMLQILHAMDAKNRIVVLDTASQLDLSWLAYYLDDARQPKTRQGEFDTQKFYSLVRTAWLTLHNQLHAIAPRLIYTFHTRNVVEPGERDTSAAAETLRNVVKAGALPGEVSLTIAMTGQARDMMIREATMVFHVKAFPDPKNPGQMVRKAYSQITDGVAAKSRWQLSIPPVAEANLGKLLDLVRANLGSAA